MREFAESSLGTLAYFLDFAAVGLFCCIISVVIFPVVGDRLLFYIPKLIKESINNEVYIKSIFITFLEVLLWVGISACSYLYLYFYMPYTFELATIGSPAIVAWTTGAINTIRRLKIFDITIRKYYYYEIYMRFIKPEALAKYTEFVENLNSLDIETIRIMTGEPMQYIYKQAVVRKLHESITSV